MGQLGQGHDSCHFYIIDARQAVEGLLLIQMLPIRSLIAMISSDCWLCQSIDTLLDYSCWLSCCSTID
jgi:hypothetical protein